ncbi:hypothetical protein [Vibrio phage J14]|nr:hypothetical protein [Vibrio phage J14]
MRYFRRVGLLGGFSPIDDGAKSLDVEERRREAFKLLRGYDQTHMAEIFGVHRQTIVKDMNVVRYQTSAGAYHARSRGACYAELHHVRAIAT